MNDILSRTSTRSASPGVDSCAAQRRSDSDVMLGYAAAIDARPEGRALPHPSSKVLELNPRCVPTATSYMSTTLKLYPCVR